MCPTEVKVLAQQLHIVTVRGFAHGSPVKSKLAQTMGHLVHGLVLP